VTPVVGPQDRDARIIDVELLVVPSPTSPLPSDVYEELLALADDELVIGHRHSEWLGLSPFLEEDLTLSSIAQDEFGHARALYALIWPKWTEREAGITRRPASEWRSCALVELHGQPWERALVRHLLYDLAEPHRSCAPRRCSMRVTQPSWLPVLGETLTLTAACKHSSICWARRFIPSRSV
jgi:hypothetical protein